MKNGFVEQRIIQAVRQTLSGRVNEVLEEMEFAIPLIELGQYHGASVASPVITLFGCERTEKERIIRLDAYSLAITLTVPEAPESETHCYAYAGAIDKAIHDDPTLGGAVDRAAVTAKKFIAPKKPHCGEWREVVIALRITVEELSYVC